MNEAFSFTIIKFCFYDFFFFFFFFFLILKMAFIMLPLSNALGNVQRSTLHARIGLNDISNWKYIMLMIKHIIH